MIIEFKNGWAGHHDPYRVRKLLAHKKEILKMASFLEKSSNTALVPLRVHVGSSLKIKLVVGQCYKGENTDKRQKERQKEAKSTITGALKGY